MRHFSQSQRHADRSLRRSLSAIVEKKSEAKGAPTHEFDAYSEPRRKQLLLPA